MKEAELKFEREERSGVIPVGTYLFDAARRLGIEVDCERLGESDACAMRVTAGEEFLSQVTEKEKQHLTAKRLKNGERLACQVRIETPGEITVMTHEKKEEEKPKEAVRVEEYRKEFEELPLEKKVASLLELEAITLSETFSFVLNSPSHIVGKVMDVLAEFGLKLEEKDKEAKRPKEHQPDDETADETDEADAAETVDAAAGSGKGDKPARQNKKKNAGDNSDAGVV